MFMLAYILSVSFSTWTSLVLVGHLVPNCPALLGLLQASIGLQLSNKAGIEIMAVVVKENASKGVHSAEGIKTENRSLSN